jgi:hypothetical protein
LLGVQVNEKETNFLMLYLKISKSHTLNIGSRMKKGWHILLQCSITRDRCYKTRQPEFYRRVRYLGKGNMNWKRFHWFFFSSERKQTWCWIQFSAKLIYGCY